MGLEVSVNIAAPRKGDIDFEAEADRSLLDSLRCLRSQLLPKSGAAGGHPPIAWTAQPEDRMLLLSVRRLCARLALDWARSLAGIPVHIATVSSWWSAAEAASTEEVRHAERCAAAAHLALRLEPSGAHEAVDADAAISKQDPRTGS